MSNWKLRKINAEDKSWKMFIEKHPHLLFHEPLWARVTEEGFGSETCCLLLEKNGKILGGMLGFIKRILWAKFLYFSIPYGGLVGESPDYDEFEKLVQEFARKEKITRIRIVDSPMMPPTPNAGFRVIESQTHILNLKGKSHDDIWNRFRPEIKRNIKKAIRSGVTIEEAQNRLSKDAFFPLYLESMKRNKTIPKYGRRFVNAVIEQIVKTGRGNLLLAKLKNKIIAGVLLVNSENIAHYLLGGSHSELLMYRPNDLLFFEAIKCSINNGASYFDFLPSGIEDHSLRRFKRKWGAKPYPAHTLEMVTQAFRMKTWNIAFKIGETKPVRIFLQWHQDQTNN